MRGSPSRSRSETPRRPASRAGARAAAPPPRRPGVPEATRRIRDESDRWIQVLSVEKERDELSNLFDWAPVPLLSLAKEGRIGRVNLAAATLLDLPRARLAGRALVDFVLREDRRALHRFLRRTLVGRASGAVRIRLKPGARARSVSVLIKGSVRTGETGPTYLLAVVEKDGGAFREDEIDGQELVRAFPDPWAVVDSRLTVVGVNPAFLSLVGRPEEEVTGSDLGAPFDSAPTRESLRRRLADADLGEKEPLVFLWARGSEPARLLQVRTLKLSGADEDRLLLVLHDLTRLGEIESELRASRNTLEERVGERTAELTRVNKDLRTAIGRLAASEEELRERDERFARFMGRLPGLAYLKDAHGRILLVNDYLARLGGDPEAAQGGTSLGILDSAAEAEIVALERRVLDRGEPVDATREIRIGGRPVLFQAALFPIPRREETWLGAYWADVTERMKAERGRMFLAAAMDQVAEAVMVCDRERTVLYANPAFAGFLERPPGEIVDRDAAEVFREAGDSTLSKELRKVLQTGREARRRFERLSGDRKMDWEEVLAPIRDESGQVAFATLLLRDVTEQVAMERHLRRKQKSEALGTLAGGIAHDFNNLLIPVIINTELALHHLPEGGQVRHYLTQALSAAERGKQLVKQIVSLVREEEHNLAPLHVSPVIRETLDLLRASLPSTVEIRVRSEAPADYVQGDPTQLHQLVLNLGNNAAHAMDEKGGVLEVSTTVRDLGEEAPAVHPDLKPGSWFVLSVRDTGPGIRPEILDRIFDPFFTTKPSGKGSGMGLAIVQGIVRNHGGAIAVDSAPGKGTRFDVYLPLLPDARGKRGAGGREALAGGTERILLVDDEEIVIRAEQTMLRHLGYRVTALRDGQEALEAFRADPDAYDLVVTDQGMPRLAGDALAREVLRIRPDLPVVLCTGYNETLDEAAARRLGVRTLLMKPFSIRELSETIRAALDSTKDK